MERADHLGPVVDALVRAWHAATALASCPDGYSAIEIGQIAGDAAGAVQEAWGHLRLTEETLTNEYATRSAGVVDLPDYKPYRES